MLYRPIIRIYDIIGTIPGTIVRTLKEYFFIIITCTDIDVYNFALISLRVYVYMISDLFYLSDCLSLFKTVNHIQRRGYSFLAKGGGQISARKGGNHLLGEGVYFLARWGLIFGHYSTKYAEVKTSQNLPWYGVRENHFLALF